MDFKVFFSQLSVLYTKLTQQQRIIITVAIVGIVSFLIFMVVFTVNKNEKVKYEVLFDSLSSFDAVKVVEQLEKDEIPYELLDENVIKVPKDVVYKERITIAALGIAKDAGVGFRDINFDQKIKYLRALEDELSHTINTLSPVDNASVNLALAKDAPTASVMLTLLEGQSLSFAQVRGVKNLVAAAVLKLSPKNVTLIDGNGITLGDGYEMDHLGELSTVQQKYKFEEEKKRQKKIIEIISPFVGGASKVIAQVTVEYDFSVQNSTSEIFDPESVVRTEKMREEVEPTQGLKSEEKLDKYEKNTATANYAIGKTVQTTKSEFARIKRITAAVIIDGKYKYKLDPDNINAGEVEYQALEESDLEALSSLVRQSIGINEDRGDVISVKNLQFKRENNKVMNDPMSQVSSIIEIYFVPFSGVFKYILVFILLLILYKKVIVPFSITMLEVSKEEESIKPTLVRGDDDEDLLAKAQVVRKKVEGQLGLSDAYSEDELKYNVLLDKVKVMVDDSPEDIAALLGALLNEEAEVTAVN